MGPLTLLPSGVTLDYLRRLVNLDPRWTLTVVYDTAMDLQYWAQVEWNILSYQAMIMINGQYHFSGASLARAISHELLELATIDTWLIFKQADKSGALEQQYRTARDKQIEQRMSAMPFWGPYDVPVPRSS